MPEETLQSSNSPAEPMPSKAAETTTSDCWPHAAASAPDAAEDVASTSAADKSADDKSVHAPPIPGWLLSVLGHVLAGVLGLVLGWLILNWVRPDALPEALRFRW
jgi:hypothetical protein